uniref:ATP synthase F0 subunit 6 n=1 Tax=Ixodes kuntzi TaxID=2926933 RepID=UPI001FAFB1E5|nr:ATP synthase F0 subunit 6 [Ixodes kuntzi]UNO53641.1 ATP synthase F0 subunit 6 [Ixodes kuntzi]
MMNIFSIFDPSTSKFFSLNWISIFSLFLIYPSLFWVIPSRNQMIWKKVLNAIIKEMKSNLSFEKQKFSMMFISIFVSIIIMNCLGLLPYVFTPTSHIIMSMMMAFPLWINLMLKGWISSMNKMFIHLVPMGSPLFLSSFMVIIESISNIIRPITLSVRLSANMISGHLLIHLLSSLPFQSPNLFLIIFPISIMLMILETAVALIQSYVFITLSSLYTNEI